MRDLETIDAELRLLATVRRSIREHGGEPSSRQVDQRPGHYKDSETADVVVCVSGSGAVHAVKSDPSFGTDPFPVSLTTIHAAQRL